MKASIKILILSACLLAAGALIASAGFLAGGRGFFVDQGLHIIASSETERLEEKTALERVRQAYGAEYGTSCEALEQLIADEQFLKNIGL